MIKYPKFNNHYLLKTKEGYLDYWLSVYPDLENIQYILQEKMHGANCQIVVKPDMQLGEYELFSRNQEIELNKDFHGIRELLKIPSYVLLLAFLHRIAITAKQEIGIYGEVLGKGVVKKNPVSYGDQKIRFFDIRAGENMLTPEQFLITMAQYREDTGGDLCVPVFGIFNSLQEALNFSIDKQISKIDPNNDHLVEGAVVKPYKVSIKDENDEIFFLKLKNEWALEKDTVTTPSEAAKDAKAAEDDLLEALQKAVLLFLTQARILAVVSKEVDGLTSPKQFGTYIRLITEDIKADIQVELPDLYKQIEEFGAKKVYNIGKNIVPMLKAYLDN